MRMIGLNHYTSHFFGAVGIAVFLAFGLSVVHAANISAPDSVISSVQAPEEAADDEASWFLWLEEGNEQTFIQKLSEIAQCIKDEEVDVEQFPIKTDEMSPCQRQAWNAVNYRDPDGHNLLQTYLKHSRPDKLINGSLITEHSIDIFTLLAVKDAFDVINALTTIGMVMVDWNNQQPDFDNLFFLAIQYDRLVLLNFLLAKIKETDANKFGKLAQFRSSKGVSIANALQQKDPDGVFILHMITDFELVSETGLLKNKTGDVYTGVEAHLKKKKSEL